jgi:hypothetical protein
MLFWPGEMDNGPVSKCRRVAPWGTASEMICVGDAPPGRLAVDPALAPAFASGLELLPAHADITTTPATAQAAMFVRDELLCIRRSVKIEE